LTMWGIKILSAFLAVYGPINWAILAIYGPRNCHYGPISILYFCFVIPLTYAIHIFREMYT
jgi:hypothetical protein